MSKQDENPDDLELKLARYEEQAAAHAHAAIKAREYGYEEACVHQIEQREWYEREAEKLRRLIAQGDLGS